jgi:hypothetical protein
MSATIVVKMRGMQARRSLEQREQYRHDFLCPDLAVDVLVDDEKLLGDADEFNRDFRAT